MALCDAEWVATTAKPNFGVALRYLQRTKGQAAVLQHVCLLVRLYVLSRLWCRRQSCV
jgi:hypothetical protein